MNLSVKKLGLIVLLLPKILPVYILIRKLAYIGFPLS